MNFNFDYLGELKFIFENTKGLNQGTRWRTFDEKNQGQKYNAYIPLRQLLRQEAVWNTQNRRLNDRKNTWKDC